MASSLVGTPAAGARVEPTSKPVVLGRHSVFMTDSTRSILVRLPRPVNYKRDFRAAYAGGGRFRGFVLAKLGDRIGLGGTPYVSDVSAGWCHKPGCKPTNNDHKSFPTNIRKFIPAGTYRLYQIADGPMKLTLRFDSLRGSIVAAPPDPVEAEIVTLPVTFDSPRSSVVAAGDFTSLPGGAADFSALGLWVRSTPHAVTGYGECFYEPTMLAASLPREVAFAPNCPTGENMWKDGFPQIRATNPTDPNGTTVRWVIAYEGVPISGIGGWFDTASQVEDFGAVALWMNFEETDTSS